MNKDTVARHAPLAADTLCGAFQVVVAERDNAIRQRFLESSTYPTATFVPTSIEGLPEAYREGQEIPDQNQRRPDHPGCD